MKNEKKGLGTGTRSFRVGGYSVVAIVIVVAICVVLNFIMGIIPTAYTEFDTTTNGVYTLSSQTKDLVKGLNETVNVYWICQSGSEDTQVKQLLDRYKGLGSQNLTVEEIDPDSNPGFVSQYVGDETVYNNSLIVVSAKRSTYVSYSDILVADYSSYYTDGTVGYNFDGESCLTSAINRVITDTLPVVYNLTGHGEDSLSDAFATAVKNENIDLQDLSLLTVSSIPEDASAIFINDPQSDLTEDEAAMVEDYLSTGGNMILITPPFYDSETFANLFAIMESYGVQQQPGIVVEGSSGNYVSGYPYYVLPSLGEHEITTPISSAGYSIGTPMASGMAIRSDLPKNVTVTSLLTTSSSSYLISNARASYTKQSGDPTGSYSVAAAIEKDNDDGSDSQIVWISCEYIVNDSVNTQLSGGNQDFFLNCLDWMCEMQDNISIHAKNVSLSYLTVDNTVSIIMAVIIIGILPVGYAVIGVVRFIRRKRR